MIRAVEDNGGVVVAFENCNGAKSFDKLVDEENPDVYDALARRYLNIGCSVMTPNPNRLDLLDRLILAAGVFIPLLHWQMNPMYGAAAMSLSSFCVVSNALRLNLFDIRSTKHDHKRKAHKTSKKENTTMNKTIKIEGMI